MALSPAVTSILETLEQVSSMPVNVVPDGALRVPGRVQMARGGAKAHLAIYNPGIATAEYYLAFEAAFAIRLFQTPAGDRALFAGTGRGMEELRSAVAETPAMARVPKGAREQFLVQLHDGLLTQLRSQPIGMAVNAWLMAHHSALREQQIQGIAQEQRQAAQALSPEIRALSPAKVWQVSTRMNAAVALFTDRLLGERRYAVPFEAAGLGKGGEELLSLLKPLGNDAAHDRERVDQWGDALGLVSWYTWVPLT